MNARLDRLRSRLPELDAGALLVTNGTNVRYLTGFASTNAWLLAEAERTFLLTDGRYAEAAKTVAGVEVIQAEADLARDLRDRLPSFALAAVGFEAAHVSYATYAVLGESGIDLVPTRMAVEELRTVKDDAELDAIRRAALILNDTLELLASTAVIGKTEAEIAWWVERTLRELGAEAMSFDPIVASGPNAALPHHHPGPRVIQPDEILLVDAGCKVDGYCSDCTRTFATGSLPATLERAYETCREAQARSLEAVRAGVACRDADAVARGYIRELGYEVVHSLGHSVGLDIHEYPRLTDTSEDTIAPGNVLTVEPGVYLPGLGGIRIEDLVVVGPDGLEILTPVTKDLLRLA